jgi:glucosamine kinase
LIKRERVSTLSVKITQRGGDRLAVRDTTDSDLAGSPVHRTRRSPALVRDRSFREANAPHGGVRSGQRDLLLAIDAGGTATRALLIDRSGSCIGFGRAGGGNPTASGAEAALRSVAEATASAVGALGSGIRLSSAAVAMAGGRGLTAEEIRRSLGPLAPAGAVTIEPDLLAMFCSGTISLQGHVLVAGTGSVSAGIRSGELDVVADGLGWLIGDRGSGYWIGHQVLRAAAAALDGVAPPTALTDLVRGALGLPSSPARIGGRPQVLMDLVDAVYAAPPVELSRFAPLAFEARHDPVARAILTEAAAGLAETLTAVRPPDSGAPVVLGGGVLTALLDTELAEPLHAVLAPAERIRVQDGIVGAAVLALRRAGTEVDRATFDRLRSGLAALRAAAQVGEAR